MKRLDKIRQYYNKNNQPNKPDYYLLGWESGTAQKYRFKALINNLDLHGKKILDIGCGTGNFLEYIEERFENFEYTGVDILEHMVSIAQSKKLKGKFLCLDIFKENPFKHNEFDKTFASGIFNINLGNNKEFIIEALRLFNFISKETISFNLLNIKSPNKEDKYFYTSPDEIINILNNNFKDCFDIKILEGYLQNDFTVVCNKIRDNAI